MVTYKNKSKRNSRKQQNSAFIWLFGKHSCMHALNNPQRVCHQILVTQNSHSYLTDEMTAIETHIVSSQEISSHLPPDAVHQGIAVKVSPLVQPDLLDIIKSDSKNNNLVILDHVTDPHNIGAILRSAAAFDIAAIVTTDRCSPKETGTLTKTASGACENTPLIAVTNLARSIEQLKEHGYWIIGLDGHADKSIQSIDLNDKIAIVLGAEGKGLRPLTRKHCDLLVKLPINSDRIESLNVSNAAAVCLYEITRQS